jgi:hypothetical protein
MDRCAGPKATIIIALLGDLYLAIIMDRYVGPKSTLAITLLGDL